MTAATARFFALAPADMVSRSSRMEMFRVCKVNAPVDYSSFLVKGDEPLYFVLLPSG